MTSFSDTKKIKEILLKYCYRLKLEFTDESEKEEQFHFYIREKIDKEETKIIVLNIIYRKDIDYRLEITSTVRFSPQHVRALQTARKEELISMIQEINMWVLPRDAEVLIDLGKEANFENAFYGVNNPIYEHEFNIGTLERKMNKTRNIAELIRMIIQKHLNRLVEED